MDVLNMDVVNLNPGNFSALNGFRELLRIPAEVIVERHTDIPDQEPPLIGNFDPICFQFQ